MAVELKVPQLGESITEAVVGKWHKKVGDAVKADEPLVVLETDKVTVDVPAPAAGALEQHLRRGGRRRCASARCSASIDARRRRPPPRSRSRRSPPPAAAPRPPLRRRATDARIDARRARRSPRTTGVDVTQVKGSGAGGRITKEDVLGHGRTTRPQLRAGARPPRHAPSRPPPARRAARSA